MSEDFHSEHCRRCKAQVHHLLLGIYGDCRPGHSFPWPAHPDEYGKSIIGPALRQIHEALKESRGYADFVKSARMPPCDFYLPEPGFVLEFDESQHFTRARAVTLLQYPPEVRLGFSIARWSRLCREIDARDDVPLDRDERRAWYDTLRDLLPQLYGLKPTVRLYWKELRWCSLESESKEDREEFRRLLESRLSG
jgi:hypothetical protein